MSLKNNKNPFAICHLSFAVRSFTLVELMIAASLMVVVFGSIFALINYGLYALSYVQNNLTASFLAQEGIELVIKRRTENWLYGFNFDYLLGEGFYRVDYLGDFDSFSIDKPLWFDEARGFQYESGRPTDFTRTIEIQRVDPEHLRVISTVVWKSKGNDFSVVVEDHLYNWFEVEPE
jgi:hypothetical protein